jgi:hypothetical protein
MRKKSTEVIDERPVVAVEEEDKKRELEPHASTQEKDIKAREKKTESMSVTTDSTDHSVELATIETAEKKNVGLRPEVSCCAARSRGVALILYGRSLTFPKTWA